MNNFGDKVSFIWSVADPVYEQYQLNQYGDDMLPSTSMIDIWRGV